MTDELLAKDEIATVVFIPTMQLFESNFTVCTGKRRGVSEIE